MNVTVHASKRSDIVKLLDIIIRYKNQTINSLQQKTEQQYRQIS
jgi:hypothetical protein